MKISTKIVCLCSSALLLLGSELFAQNYFTAVNPAATNQVARTQVTQKVSKMGLFSLNEAAMRKHLLVAPMEFHNNGKFIPLQVPLPDGTVETFNMVESPVLSPEIALQNPEIKSYTGNGVTDKARIIRISLTSSGFSAIILNVNGDAVYFEPYSKNQPGVYFNYFTKDAIVPANFSSGSRCGTLPSNTPPALPAKVSPIAPTNGGAITNGTTVTTTTGATLSTYRLAFAADGEFVMHNGGTVQSGYDAVVAYVNRIKAFYRNELSVDFTLVSGKNLIYTDTTNDPYTNSDQDLTISQNQTNVDGVIGSANYDIAHVWGYTGGSGGGLAASPCLGVNGEKAMGTSGEGDLTSYAQVFMDQLVFHEMGHQFSMSHSYNSVIPVCTTRRQNTSMEPGSGATIMSYGFTCDNDDYYDSTNVAGQKIGPFLNFHNVSYQQAVAYMATIPAIGTKVTTGNTAPVITMPTNYTIPQSTPFTLTASATDVNGDALTYSWEGAITGTSAPPDASTLANTALPPYSRSYAPVSSGTRTFPRLDSILSGANYAKGDKLPSVGVTADSLTFTVRDNNASGGGVAYGYEIITIDANQSPLLITNDLTGSKVGLSAQVITWSVNLASTLATPLVKISLSTDGGLTFPTTLLATTANIGTAPVILPNVSTSTARIKVEAVNNIFFDISNNNFTITSILPVTLTSFTATLQNKKDALLKWETATETNSKGYEVEMSTGSTISFADISFVAAKGTTNAISDYSFVAPNLAPGTYYFRLRMIDIDGTFTYSAVQSITVVGDKGLISIYPTPVHDQLTVVLSTEMQNAQLQLVNSLGQVLMMNTTPNGNIRLLNMGGLPAGLYLLKVMNGTNLVTTQKVVKE